MSANGCQKRVVAVLTAMGQDGTAPPSRAGVQCSIAPRASAADRDAHAAALDAELGLGERAEVRAHVGRDLATSRARNRVPFTVMATSSADHAVRTVPSSDAHSYVASAAGSWIATATSALTSEGN